MPHSLPIPLIQSLQGVPGFDADAFINLHQSGERITSVRYQQKKLSDVVGYELPSEPVPWCHGAFYLPERPSFTFDPLFHAGLYYVQEASSMFLWEVLEQTVGRDTAGKKVLDLCAAPGGKSTLLASYFSDGMVVSNEVIKSRATILTENITKWGMDNVVVTNNDPVHFQRLSHFFDVMVIDAPCSGSGLFRKDERAMEEWSEEAVHTCSQRQQRIIADAYDSLRQNGVLIYSTCSYSPEEDEDILDWMMQTFQLIPVRLTLQDEWHIVETTSLHNAFGYRFYPDKVKGEGLFIAAFVKEDGGQSFDVAHPITLLSQKETVPWLPWINNESLCLFKQKEVVIAVPELIFRHLSYLQKCLYIRQAGITLGEIKGKDVIPHQALAVSSIAHEQLPGIAFTKEQAIRYLQKKEIEIEVINLAKGWHRATHCGIGLGWLKVLPNRINNYYPAEWRILKN